MAFKWSPAQSAAIEAEGVDTLVSAGAGSGKTAVLTERIYHLIARRNAKISRFLVLTFTNAAAAEMKGRVRKRLLKDPNLAKLAIEIENAHIETFDSFNLFLVKKYSFELGVSQNLSILDGGVLKIKTQKVLSSIFDEEYAKKDEKFLSMIYKYCINDDKPLKDLIISIMDLANKQIDRDAYLDSYVNRYFDENRLKGFVENAYDNNIKYVEQILNMSRLLQDSKDAYQIEEAISPLLECENYDEFYNLIKTISFPTKPRNKDVSDKDFRDRIKDIFEKVSPGKDSDFGTSEEIISSYMSTKPVVELLIDIAKRANEELDKYKFENSSYSFDDVSRMAIKCLKNPAIRKEMSEYFDYIMVDEYQDTSDTQETILTSIKRDNLYMVGDVKQSIYAFRNANCNIFLDKYNAYKELKGGREIDLNTSYRSRSEVVDFVNDIFGKLMVPENNIIDYSNGHHFGFGLTSYEDNIDPNMNYNIKTINYSIESGEENAPKEANIIAQDILNKWGKVEVFDKDKGLVKAEWKHFAILMDRKTNFDDYRKVFAEKNIPLKVISPEALKDTAIAKITKNFLILFNCIKNNDLGNDFKHAYISIARSFLIGDDDQKIYEVFKEASFEDQEIYDKMNKLVKSLRFGSLFEILKGIYTAFDVYNEVFHIGNVSSNIHKAESFLEAAKSLDTLGCTLEDFITYFNDLDEYDVDVEFSDGDASSNAVTLINFHKSKGLEYPICYFAGLVKKFYRPTITTSFLVNDKYGVVLPLEGASNKTNLFNSMLKSDTIQGDLEERLRLFYVAVTRARESITFIIGQKDNASRPQEFKDCFSHADFIKLTNYDSKTNIPEPEKPEYINPDPSKIMEVPVLEFKKLDIAAVPIGRVARASKEIIEDVDDSLLDFGTQVHYLLETANYETKDVSYIKDNRLRKYVSNVLNCGLFDNVQNEQVLHEYAFFDEVNNTNGIIDCLIIKEDEIDIIDFKLKNISDSKYNKQLNIYRRYIESISDKNVNMYLISSITGEVKQVEKD